MTEIKNCEHCGADMKGKRADAKFCSESCRKKNVVQKKLEAEQPQVNAQVNAETFFAGQNDKYKRFEKQELNMVVEEHDEMIVIPNHTDSMNLTIYLVNKELESINNQIDDWHELKDQQSMEMADLQRKLKKTQEKQPLSITEFVLNEPEYEIELEKAKHINQMEHGRHSFAKIVNDTAFFLSKTPTMIFCYKEGYLLKFKQEKEDDIDRQSRDISKKEIEIRKSQRKIDDLIKDRGNKEADLNTLKKTLLEVIAAKERKKAKIISRQEADQAQYTHPNYPEEEINKTTSKLFDLKRVDLKNVNFEMIKLNGAGKVLGNFYRGKAFIFLKGAAGAGKTNFSFYLLSSFFKANFKCAYLVLETSYSLQIQLLADKFGLLPSENMAYYEFCDMYQFEKLCQSDVDVIFIDSWQKLNLEPKKVDILRMEYPNLIFIAITQQTNDGRIRGGNSLYHDATAILDVRNENSKRSIYIEKSRYENHGKTYNLN